MSRAARIGTLALPSLAAWAVVSTGPRGAAGGPEQLVRAAATALLPLFLVMVAALVVRAVEAAGARRPWAEALDVLTAPGRALVWTGALMTVGAVPIGWASLAVVGVGALGLVCAMVTWTALVAGGDEPWRALSLTRAFAPATAVEGDALREQLTMAGARIPPGFRLLARGGLRRHAAAAYVVEAAASGGEVSLQADLGPARRGEYEAPPVEVWLRDLFGLCRSRRVRLGAARVTVLPRPLAVDELAAIAGARGDDADSMPAQKLPTEGCFRLRAYTPGDDARRIHWVRSLMTRELTVRLPDELPPEQPAVRLVLDTQLSGADTLATPAVSQLCDALVRVWLSAGQALTARGVRVTMVAAVGEPLRVVEKAMTPQLAGAVLRVGARADWQGTLPLSALLGDGTRQIVVSARPRPVEGGAVTWIVVPEVAWTDPEPWPLRPAWVTLPHPSGAADNRWLRRRRERQAHDGMRRAGVVFDQLLQWVDGPHLAGSFVARPRAGRVALEAIP